MPAPTSPRPPLAASASAAAPWLIAGAAVGVRVALALTTHRTAEDALITLRYAENLAAGHGFVYNTGERVLGTTTPLYTLLLALAACLFGPGSGPNITGKALNILADGATCLLLCAWLRRIGRPGVGLAAAALYAVDPRALNWNIAGMETGLVTLATTAALVAFACRRPTWSAAALALLVLLRVDGLLLAGVLLAASILQERRLPLRPLLVFLALTLPWVLFASLYFGSPLPTSVQAKFIIYPRFATSLFPQFHAFRQQMAGSIPDLLLAAAFLVGTLLIIASHSPRHCKAGPQRPVVRRGPNPTSALRPSTPQPPPPERPTPNARRAAPNAQRRAEGANADALQPALLWTLLYFTLFATSKLILFGWYLVPPLPVYLTIASLGLADGLQALTRRSHRPPHLLPTALTALLILAQAARLPDLQRHCRQVQTHEDTLRKAVGLWIRDHTPADSALMVESIGYIGYYSRRPLLDAAGLVSPQVLPSYRQDIACPLWDILQRFHPDYALLYEREYDWVQTSAAGALERDYQILHRWPALPGDPPGAGFVLLQRLVTPTHPPHPIEPFSVLPPAHGVSNQQT